MSANRIAKARPSSELFGRAADVARIRQWLDSGEPLLTLTGSPGVGKTALAIWIARKAADEGERVISVDLSSADCALALCQAVLGALGLASSNEAGESEGALRLAAALAAAPCLLVLDNFEQLLPAGAVVIERCIEQASGLRLLVTSRERLRLAEERVLELLPLDLPADPADPMRSPAVELFMARAAAAGVELDRNELGDVARLVSVLDGVPLAIELTAARTPLMRPAELVQRLEQPALGLAGAIFASWMLLNEADKPALVDCAEFRGSFSVQAALCVLEPKNALDRLQSLRDKSLIVADPFDRSRLRLLFVVRTFVAERRSEIDPERTSARRHALWTAQLVRQASAELERGQVRAAVQLMFREYEEIEAGIDHLLGTDDLECIELALEMLLGLCRLDRLSDIRVRLIQRLDRALESSVRLGGNPALVCRALIERGFRRQLAGTLALAEADCEAAIELASTRNFELEQGRALRILAAIRLARGQLDDARTLAGRALEIGVRIENSALEGWAHDELGLVHHRLGDQAAARKHGEEALAIFRRLRDELEQIPVLVSLTFIHIEAGDLELGRLVAREGLELFNRLAVSRSGLALFLEFALARADHAAAALIEAQERYSKCAALAEALGDLRMVGISKAYWAFVAFELGDRHLACLELRHALAITGPAEDDQYVAFARACLGVVEAALGHRVACEEQLQLARETFRGQTDGPLAAAVRALGQIAQGSSPSALEIAAGERRLFELGLVGRFAQAFRTPAKTQPLLRLTVAEDGSWFVSPEGERVSCAGRPVLRRLLVGLAEHHRKQPGASLDSNALLAIGWPGERMLASAAKRRLQVMISRMRELGLKSALETTPTGYRLAELVEVSFAKARA